MIFQLCFAALNCKEKNEHLMQIIDVCGNSVFDEIATLDWVVKPINGFTGRVGWFRRILRTQYWRSASVYGWGCAFAWTQIERRATSECQAILYIGLCVFLMLWWFDLGERSETQSAVDSCLRAFLNIWFGLFMHQNWGKFDNLIEKFKLWPI